MHVMAATGVWFILVPPKVEKLAGEWQPSQAMDPVGRWLLGGVLIVIPVNVLPVPWQVMQPLAIPAWFIAVPGPNLLVDA
jgi:hypothetical protein